MSTHDCLQIDWVDVDGSTLTEDDFVTLNTSGVRYLTLKRTLQRFPNTLLGDSKQRNPYFVKSKNAYFFNRCLLSFDAILYFYQSNGTLNCPKDVSITIFEQECRYFCLPKKFIDSMKRKEGIFPDLDGGHRNRGSSVPSTRVEDL